MFETLRRSETRDRILSSKELKSYVAKIEKRHSVFSGTSIDVIKLSDFKRYYETGDRQVYELAYFTRRERMMVYAFMYWFYGDVDDLKELEDVLWAICSEYTWALPAHTDKDKPLAVDLFACETAYALSEILYMLDGDLDEQLVSRIRKETDRRIFIPYRDSDGYFMWEVEKHNWSSVCAASIGMVMLYQNRHELFEESLSRLKRCLLSFLDSFESDGTCLEGVTYWTYGMYFFMAFLDLIENSPYEESFKPDENRLEAIAQFQQKSYMNSGMVISFSDADGALLYQPGLTAYLSNRYDSVQIPPVQRVASYDSDHCYRFCYGLRNLVWTALYWDQKHVVDDSPKSYQLPAAQWFICNGDKPYSYGLAAKGGCNDEPHNHNDVGSFIFYKDGVAILTDLGAGEYTKAYFSDARYEIINCSSRGHNVPIIDGMVQAAGPKYKAKLISMSDRQMTIEMSNAYEVQGLDKYERSFAFCQKKGVSLSDTLEVKRDGIELVERFISRYEPMIVGSSVCFGVENGKGETTEINIRVVGSGKFMAINVTEDNTSSHGGEEEKVYLIDFSFELEAGCNRIRFEIE